MVRELSNSSDHKKLKEILSLNLGPFLDVNIPAGGLFTGAEEIKTEADAARFGGVVGESYDQCYHQVSSS